MISDETALRLEKHEESMRSALAHLNSWAEPNVSDFERNVLDNPANDRRWLVYMLAQVMDYAELLEWRLARANGSLPQHSCNA